MSLLILLLGFLIIEYFSGSQAENAFSIYWKENIGHPPTPRWLAAKASPLSPRQAVTIIELLDKNELASHLHKFCKQANIACSTNALVKNAMNDTDLPPIAEWILVKFKYELPNLTPLSVASQVGLPYFRESMVKEGGFMPIPDLRDPMSYRSFLPRSLASRIPFFSTHTEELKKLFDVADESKMDEYIQDTLEVCEKSPIQDELIKCATSAEDLIDFVVDEFGHNIQIWSTENVNGSYKNVSIGVVKLIHGNFSEPLALCHSQPFPFQVYYCHVLPKVKLYAIDMLLAQRKVNQAIMACHFDTSVWNPNHLAFKLLGFGPGLIEVCHWINENGMVLTKALM